LNRYVELATTVKATLAILDTDLHILSSKKWKICKEYLDHLMKSQN